MTHTPESTQTLEPCLSDEIIPDLNNIVRAIEDEGDRCYLGSTNDAERLREIANWLETKFRRTPPASQSAKPVAWRYHYPGAEELAEVRLYEGMSCEEEAAGMVETPLYAHPPATASQSDEALVEEMVRAIDASRKQDDSLYNYVGYILPTLKREVAKAKADAEMLAETAEYFLELQDRLRRKIVVRDLAEAEGTLKAALATYREKN